MRGVHRYKKAEDTMSRIRFGHTGLNITFFIMKKHATGKCEYCDNDETVEHVFLHCNQQEGL